jgi:hypothetical protein
LGVLGLLVVLGLVAPHFLAPWLRRTLIRQVASQTHGQYQLQINTLHVSLWQRAVRLRGVRLRPAAVVADTIPRVRLDVAELHVTGIGLLALLRKGVVPIDSVVLDSAHIEVLALARRPTKEANKPWHERLPLKGLDIDYFGLLHVSGNYLPKSPAAARFRRADLSAQHLLISPESAADTQRLAYATAWSLLLQNTQAQATGHQLTLASLRISTADRALQADSLQLQSLSTSPKQNGRVNLALPRLRLTGFDAATVLHQRRFWADSLLVQGPQLTVATMPETSPKSTSWPQCLRSLDLTHLAVHDGHLQLPGTPTKADIEHIEVAGTGLHLDSTAKPDARRVFFAQAWEVALGRSRATVAAHAVALGSLKLSTKTGTFELRSVRVRPPGPGQGQPSGVRVDLVMPSLTIAGLSAAALQQRYFQAKILAVSNARLNFTPPTQPPPPLWKLLGQVLHRTDLAQLQIQHSDLRIGRWRHSPHAQDVNATATAIRIDSVADAEPRRILYARAWQVSTGELSAPFDPPFYRASSAHVRLDTDAHTLRFESMQLRPRYSPVEMNLRKGYQAPAVTIKVAALALAGLDFAGLVRHGDFRMKRATVQSPSVIIASDGRGPINPNWSKISPEEMIKLPITVDVRRLDLINGNLYSRYRSPLTPIVGTMSINRFNGTFLNLSNDPRHQTAATPLTGQAYTYLQNRCRLDARVSMYLLDPKGRHRVWGQFGPGQFSMLNPMTVPTRLVAFKSGDVHRIRFDLHADRKGVQGTMWAEYTRLQMTLFGYKEQDVEVKKTLFSRIKSKAVNAIVIRDQNPRKRGELVTGEMTSTREPRFSVFTLWRQGIVSGLFNNVGVPQKLAQKLSETKDEAPLPR